MMIWRNTARGMLLIGVGLRLAWAVLVVMSIWVMFFWAISIPG